MRKFLLFLLFVLCSASGFAAMTAPTLYSPKNVLTDVTVDLISNSVTGADLYQFQVDTTPNFNSNILITGSPVAWRGKTFTVKNLYFGKKYYWRVRVFAINKTDSSGWSSTANFTTRAEVLLSSPVNNAVKIRTAPQLSYTTIGATYYDMELDTSIQFNSPLLRQVALPSTSYLNNFYNLYFGTKYYWRVRARTLYDTSKWSTIRNFTTVAIPENFYPQNKAVTQYIYDNIKWILGTGGFYDSTYIELLIDTSADYSSPAVRTFVIYNYNQQPLYSYVNKTHYWKIRAYNYADTTPWTQSWSYTTNIKQTLYTPPTNAVTQLITNLTFNRVADVKGYTLEIDTIAEFTSAEKIVYDIPYQSFLRMTKTVTLPFFNTQYFWRVRAYYDIDTTDWTDIWSIRTPGEVNLKEPAENAMSLHPQLNLVWDTFAGAQSYDYEVDTTYDFSSAYKISGTTGPKTNLVQLNELYFGKKYFWRVRANSARSATQWAGRSFYTIDTVEQVWPAEDFYSALDAQLWWDEITGASGYQYQLSADSAFANAVLYTVMADTTLVAVPGRLKPFSKYFWRVRAFHAKDTTEWAVTRFISGLEDPVLLKPANNAINIKFLNTELDWQDVAYADFYVVERSQYGNFSIKFFDTVYSSNFVISSLPPSMAVYWRVHAVKKVQDDGTTKVYISTESEIFKFVTASGVPLAPVLIYPASKEKDISLNPVLKWEADSSAARYDINYSVNSDFTSPVAYKTSATNTLQIGPLTQNTTYFWRVRTVNAYGPGPWSAGRFTTIASTGLQEIQGADKIYVYPNPAKNILNISLPQNFELSNAEITDIQGKKILNIRVHNAQIQLPVLQPGLYILRLETNNGHYVTKFMVE